MCLFRKNINSVLQGRGEISWAGEIQISINFLDRLLTNSCVLKECIAAFRLRIERSIFRVPESYV